MNELNEILELQKTEKKLVKQVITHPYKKVVGRTVSMTKEERNQRIEEIQRDIRTKIDKKYIDINKEREKENKPLLNVPYLRKENE